MHSRLVGGLGKRTFLSERLVFYVLYGGNGSYNLLVTSAYWCLSCFGAQPCEHVKHGGICCCKVPVVGVVAYRNLFLRVMLLVVGRLLPVCTVIWECSGVLVSCKHKRLFAHTCPNSVGCPRHSVSAGRPLSSCIALPVHWFVVATRSISDIWHLCIHI